MSSLESSKNLAGIGTILLMLSVIPVAGTIIGIIGVILLLIGIKGLSEYYKDNSIYRNALWGVIFFIVGLIAFAVVMSSLIWGGIFAGMAFMPGAGLGAGILALGLLVVSVVILFLFYLLAAMYFRRAFSTLAQKTGEHMFETAGLLLFVGAILTIILVGLALILVAWILATIAFFSIRTPQTNTYAPPSQAYTQPTATRYCPNCGAPVEPNATYCPHCGKQLPPA